MDREHFIFRDPQGSRWKNLSRALGIGALLLTLIGAIFLYSLLASPRLESLKFGLEIQADAPPSVMTRPAPPAPWLNQTRDLPAAAVRHPANSVRLGLLDDDPERALASLRAHAADLTQVAPSWFQLIGMPPRLHETPEPEVAAIAAEHGLGLMPLLTNLADQGFDPEAVEELLRASPARQQAFGAELSRRLQAIGARGVIIAWEQIDPVYRAELTACIGRLRAQLGADGLELWLSVPVGNDIKVFDLEALAPQVDRFLAMLYYETGEEDPPGPLASLTWFRDWLEALTQHGDPSQWVIGLSTFAYDWPGAGTPEAISFQDAMARAVSAQVEPSADLPPHDDPSFSYKLDGVDHSVWFMDAVTFWNQQRLVLQRSLGGIGIDRLGTEDPLIWQALRCGLHCAPSDFESLVPTEAIGTVGQGDFLTVHAERQPGRRAIQVDPEGFWSERYLQYPHPARVERTGEGEPRQVAITFDDGPDPVWTPKILDVLKTKGVPATFFVIGEKANAHPELLRLILDAGHEIGNHSFSHIDLSQAGPVRTRLELNATQRAIEAITGRSTLLFRPPYDADRTPHSLPELAPLVTASELGYIPVMSSIDPQDWERPTAKAILERIQRARSHGSVILLHDGGGDRAATLAALPGVIDYLRARGDEIVPLHLLLGVPKEAVMPAIPREDPAPPRLVASTGLNLMQRLEHGAWGFLMLATVLLFARTLLVVGVAMVHFRRERRAIATEAPEFSPPVSVILAAYNEEPVIAQTLEALLASDYPAPFEVIVVDDGSTDATAAIVAALSARDARVRLLRQPNRGKAAALRNALNQARHAILVMLDADTQFLPDTLTELVRPLRDPQVGAVSAQIEVGNDAGLLGRFQRLEYIAAFNLDRRAYDLLDAIPVIPGAASAYRRAAIHAAGGIQSDTLAEDTDLTLSLHRAGYRLRHSPRARAFTEVPRRLGALFRQRKRWSFGTLQCLWKHRALCCNRAYGWLGLFTLPSIWFFQIFLAAFIPLVDLWMLLALVRGESGPLLYYLIGFMAMDLALAWAACRLEGEPVRTALWSLPMRFLYRPLLALAILHALYLALHGSWMAWGRQERWGLTKPWTARV
ncbi:glycosyltransferase [Thermochromatium tepidum]|uniref:Glycosyltransferase n=1 Tax=Thermochromatium tepidum ATCC 43061 TaxID=316276 RepID=A0A6I6ED70_THETI|nr:glycosyltransferase [Thermochromatium tepidum]QGU32040.1 glycosyltransferase [Thermochromatium tepidum ATCC 43061]